MQETIQVPLARLEEDLDERSFQHDMSYLPDNIYIFKRDDLGDSEMDKQRTCYITDDKLNELKRAYLDKDTKAAKKLEIALVDAETGNVDYHLDRSLQCLGCFAPFRKVMLTIKSVNGIDLFTVKERGCGQTYEFSPINGQTFTLHRSSTLEKVFEILDSESSRVGSISKRYTPINRRIRTRDGHYHIKFNENAADLQDEIKYVIVCGAFLLDFLFEVPSQRGMLKAGLCCWC